MPHWLAAGDLMVLPSASEGLPLVVLESLAAGTPVVASRIGGIPDCVTEGVNGILVDPSGVDSLAAGLRTALGMKWDRGVVRASAVPFGWDAQVAKLEALYASVLHNRSL
jgi:glycosyltransferase involved in cell wall biosynthesis